MLRGYRGIGFAALVAAILLSFGLGAYSIRLGQPENPDRYPSYQSSDGKEQGSLAPISKIPVAEVQRRPCHNPESETESDLCAQWRAAQAAEKSADWTLYGVIASAIGIALFIWQLALTREAVKDTGDATLAMQEANKIAREIGQSQSRCYLSGVSADFRLVMSDSLHLTYTVKNTGQSPACNVTWEADGSIYGTGIPSRRFTRTRESPPAVSIGAGAEECLRFNYFNFDLTEAEQKEIFDGDEVSIAFAIKVTGEDIFGTRFVVHDWACLTNLVRIPDVRHEIELSRLGWAMPQSAE